MSRGMGADVGEGENWGGGGVREEGVKLRGFK